MESIYTQLFVNAALRKFVWLSPLFLSSLISIPANAAPDICSTLSSPIYQVINPNSQANLLTYSPNEANNAAIQYGFTQTNGTPFSASLTAANGLVAVHRLYSAASNDFIWMTSPSEIASAVQKYGYVDQNVYFYVPSSESSCTQPVYRFLKGNKHRFAVSQADQDALAASGWTSEGIKFYAGYAIPGPTNTGVPAWVNLTPYTGPTTITVNGTVIVGKQINSLLRINAQDVVIKNSRIVGGDTVTGTTQQSLMHVYPNASLTIQDSELFAQNESPSIDGVTTYGNTILERANIHNVIDSVTIAGDNVVVRDSWLYDSLYCPAGVDPYKSDGSHSDNIQIPQGRSIQLLNNNLGEGTERLDATILVTQDLGVVTDLLIQNNLAYVGGGPAGIGGCSFNFKTIAAPLKGVVIQDNTFIRTNPCAMTMNPLTKANAVISNNTWEDNGSEVTIYNF
jgi:hypothetical protein